MRQITDWNSAVGVNSLNQDVDRRKCTLLLGCENIPVKAPEKDTEDFLVNDKSSYGSWKSKVEVISWINKRSYFFDFLKLCICWGKNHILHRLLSTKHGQQITMYLRVNYNPTVNLCYLKEYAHAQLVVYQHPYVFFSKTTFPQHILGHGVVPLLVQNFGFLAKFHEILVSLFLQIAHVPLDGSINLWYFRIPPSFVSSGDLLRASLST